MLNIKVSGIEQHLSGSDVLQCTIRTDLTPIPVTLELVVQGGVIRDFSTDEKIQITVDGYDFESVLVESNDTSETYGENKGANVKITAFLSQCAKVTYLLEVPVIQENTSFSAIYRACGASCAFSSDIPVDRFYCFSGQVPSAVMMPIFQREGAVPRWKDGKLGFWRYDDLFKQSPVTSLQNVNEELTNSEFLRRHIVPVYYSFDEDGFVVKSNRLEGRRLQYEPNANERILNNMTRVIIYKKTISANYSPDVNAGDILNLEGIDYIVITSAHQTGKKSEEVSVFWLGVLQ